LYPPLMLHFLTHFIVLEKLFQGGSVAYVQGYTVPTQNKER
jgi:hypothetical protein